MLYSDQSLDMMGVSDVQMESMVFASIADVNEGFANSEIGIDLTIVHQTMVSTCGVNNNRAALPDSQNSLEYMHVSHQQLGTACFRQRNTCRSCRHMQVIASRYISAAT